MSNTTETNAPDADAGSNEPAVDELAAAVTTAEAGLVTATEALQKAAKSGDVKAMLDASTGIQNAQKALERAKAAIVTRDFERLSGERMEFTSGLHDALKEFLADYGTDFERLGLTAIHCRFDNGTALVDITARDVKPAAGSTRGPSAGGGNKGKSVWHYQGKTFTSAELLEQFGGEAGSKAIDKARNFANYGLKFSPGFDSEVKKLAATLGATRD